MEGLFLKSCRTHEHNHAAVDFKTLLLPNAKYDCFLSIGEIVSMDESSKVTLPYLVTQVQ